MPIGFVRSEEEEHTWIAMLVKHILHCKDINCARCADAAWPWRRAARRGARGACKTPPRAGRRRGMRLGRRPAPGCTHIFNDVVAPNFCLSGRFHD